MDEKPAERVRELTKEFSQVNRNGRRNRMSDLGNHIDQENFSASNYVPSEEEMRVRKRRMWTRVLLFLTVGSAAVALVAFLVPRL